MTARVETGPGWEMRLSDCLCPVNGLASLPDRGVDHVITDPPYAPRAMKNARSSETMKQRRDGKVYDFGYAALTDEVRRAAAVQFARIARRWVVVWCDVESDHLWREDLVGAGLRYVRTGFWIRENGAPQFSGDRPAQGAEACVICHSNETKMAWNGGGRPAVWTGPIVNAADSSRVHSSPKPEWLMRAQVSDFTDPGELIADPFSGSATTLAAGRQLGRSVIGWEREPKYFEVAVKRLRAAREQLRIPLACEPVGRQATLLDSPPSPRNSPLVVDRET